MPRYIDADALMKELEREVELADDWKTAHEIYNVVKYFPTADAVEVVRCKDCKWFVGEGMYCANDFITQFDHFFCYYGERGEDAVH